MASEKQLGNIVYQVEMDVAKLIEAQREVNSRLERMQDGMNKSGRTADRLSTSLNRVGTAIAAAFTVETARRVIEIADSMSILQARISRLSSSTAEAEETMKSLSSIASVTGNSLADTEKLWESMTSSLRSAGATNSQILALTSTLQKIGTIGGSSSEEMSNALRQFGQSIAAGTIRAEEFNSVVEQMPELARQIAAGLGISIGKLRQRMLEGKLSAQDALNAIQGRAQVVNEEFDKMPISVERAKNSLDVAFKNVINDLNQSIGLTQTLAGLMQTVSDNLNYYNRNAGDASRMPKLIKMQQDLNDEVKDGQRWYETDTVYQQRRGQAAAELKQVEAEIAHIRAKAAQDNKNNGSFNSPSSTGDDKLTQKLLQNSQRRLELSKVEGAERAKLMAQYDAEDAGWKSNDPRIKALQEQYVQTLKNTDANKKSNSEGKRTEAQSLAISEKLADLKQQSELAADSTQELSREQALLRAEQSLGKGASDDQIKQARSYAAAIWDSAAAIKARNAIPELKENADYTAQRSQLDMLKNAKDAQGNLLISQQQFNSASEALEQQHQVNLAKIRANQNAGVSPLQDAQGTIDPVQQLANENARKLALIQQFETEKGVLTQNGLALMNAANTEYEQARIAAQWEIYKAQSDSNALLASTIESLSGGATNAITGLLNGTQSLSEAFANLGTAVINGVVSSLVQMGTQWVMSALMGQAAQDTAIASNQATASAALAAATISGSAAATALLSTWSPAAMAASIASYGGAASAGMLGFNTAMASAKMMSVAGAREHGGPVTANSMYRVGEGGKPEIFKASNGSQYMIPGDNGSVISNRDIGSGGGGQVVHQTIQVNGNPDDRTLLLIQQAAQQGAKQGYQMVVGDLAKGTGNASKALKSSFNTRSKIK